MGSRPLQYVTIFLTVFIDVLGFGIVIPVLPLYAEHFGATPLEIGALVGIFSLMQFVFAPFWGNLSDRFGRKPILFVGMCGTVAGYVVMGLAGSVLVLFLARMLAGVSGANIGVAQAYLADISSPENRARAMGLLGAAFGLGFVFGPALGGWVSAFYGFAAPMFLAAGLGIANLVFIAIFLPESRPGQKATTHSRIFPDLFRHVQVRQYLWSLGVYFLVIVGFSIMTTLFALYLLHRFDLGVGHTGAVLAGIGLLGVIIQGGLIGRLTKRFGEARLVQTGSIVMTAGLAGLGVAASIPQMFLAAAAVGIGNSLLMPSLSSLASRAAEPDWQGRALGLMQSGGSLARFFGPLIAGILLAVEASNPESLFPYATLPMIVAAGILCVSIAIAQALSSDRQSPGH